MSTIRSRHGFTLIELMVVVIIIAALAGMVLPRVLPASDAAKRHIAKGDIAGITVALKLYRLHENSYPSTLAALTAESPSKDWDGAYLEKAAVDPWDRDYRYKYPGSHNANGYDIWSVGADGQDGTDDDVANWGEE